MRTDLCKQDLGVLPSSDQAHDHLRASLIRNALRKLLPPSHLFLEEEEEEGGLDQPLLRLFPLSEGKVSVVLVCPFQEGVEKFFYDMLTRWLFPGVKWSPEVVFFSQFFFYKRPEEQYLFCDIRLSIPFQMDFEQVKRQFSRIASEIILGASSSYHSSRILEVRGQVSSDKHTLLHEKMAAFMHRRPEHFDYDIFGQMQHVFMSCKEEFKREREVAHLTRMVCVFYLFRRFLRGAGEREPGERHVSVKLSPVRIYSLLGVQRAWALFLGLNFLREREVLQEKHLSQAVGELVAGAKVVEGSFFSCHHKEDNVHLFYLEVEKEGGGGFSHAEIRRLRRDLASKVEGRIEKLMPIIFMPRNEEEVMKNILVLAQQLRYVKDLPQVFISFEEQGEWEITFTVILLRLLQPGKEELSLSELFRRREGTFQFFEDRVRKVGLVRGRYEKEATVFRLKGSKTPYSRRDHSLDLLKARQEVVRQLQEVMGEFRDYNGGMIANHVENFYRFKSLCVQGQEEELEAFFHALSPVEMKGVVDPMHCKKLYDLLLSCSEEGFVLQEDDVLFLGGPLRGLGSWADSLKSWGFYPSQMVSSSLEKKGIKYRGYLLLGLSQEQKERCLSEMSCLFPSLVKKTI